LPPLSRLLHYKTPPQNFEDPGSVSNDVSKKRGRGRAWFLDDLDLDRKPEVRASKSTRISRVYRESGLPAEAAFTLAVVAPEGAPAGETAAAAEEGVLLGQARVARARRSPRYAQVVRAVLSPSLVF